MDVQKQKDGTVLIKASATPEQVKKAKEHAVSHMGAHVTVPGFRAGKAPAAIVEKNLRTDKLAEETLSHVAGDVYDAAVKEQNLEPITRPSVAVPILKDLKEGESATDKLWPKMVEEGIELEITTFVTPEINLGDWQKIVKSVKLETKTESVETATSVADAKEQAKKPTPKKAADEKTDDRELEDAIIKTLTEEIKFDLPDALITGEANDLLMRQIDLIQRLGISFDDYLKTQKTTIEALQEETKKEAEKSLRAKFIISEIAKSEEETVGKDTKIQDVLRLLVKLNSK